jgi:hypothetical protein
VDDDWYSDELSVGDSVELAKEILLTVMCKTTKEAVEAATTPAIPSREGPSGPKHLLLESGYIHSEVKCDGCKHLRFRFHVEVREVRAYATYVCLAPGVRDVILQKELVEVDVGEDTVTPMWCPFLVGDAPR